MRYLLAIKGGETPSEADRKRFFDEHTRLQNDLRKQEKLVDCNPLRPAAEMVRIQAVKGGGRNVIDGPFAETKELLGGYYVIEAESRDEAVQWAKRIPLTTGTVEVYEIARMESLPAPRRSPVDPNRSHIIFVTPVTWPGAGTVKDTRKRNGSRRRSRTCQADNDHDDA